MPKRDSGAPAIAVITMAYNEHVNLPIWADYYRRALPHGELLVIDHGSDDGSVTGLPGISRIPVPRGKMDELPRTRMVTLLQASLLQYYDVVIYADCDELIVVEPELGLNLEDYLASCGYDYASPIGLNVQHIVDVEAPLHDAVPLLSQRRYCYFRSNMCKPLVTRVRLKWEAGFHTCDRPLHIDRNLYLFHTKCIDRDRAITRHKTVQDVQWTQRAISAQHGAHHRIDDDAFLQQFFLAPAARFRRHGAKHFNFEAELARLEPAPTEPDRPFNGPLVEIPERFRNIF